MKDTGKFPIGVIGIIDRKLFDVKKGKNMKYNFFIFFIKNIIKIHRVSRIWLLEKKNLN